MLVSLETLQRAGLIDPGSLVGWRYALKLDGAAGQSDGGLVAFRERVKQALPEGGFTVRDRRDPSPQVSRTLERLRQFLTLVGLTALLVGGVGVANAVATYIDRRRKVIAAFKSLGATSGTILAIHLLQVLLIAGIGIVLGIALGFLIPVALTAMVGDALPIKADLTVSARSLLTAVGYGLLVSLLFALWPLGRAEQVRAGVLFRDEVAPERVLPRRRILALIARRRPAAGGAGDLHVRGTPARALLLPGRRRRVRRLRRPRQRHRLGRQARAAPAPARAGAGDQEPRRAGRAHALGRAVAGHRPVAARHRGAGRCLHRQRADQPPAGGEPQLLRARHQARRDRCLPRPRRPRGAGGQGGGGAHAARPPGQARRPPGGAGQGAAGGAVGAQRRPRPHLFARRPGGLDGRCRASGGRPTTPASRWSPSRPRSPRGCASRSATPSPSTCSAATSRRASPICAR